MNGNGMFCFIHAQHNFPPNIPYSLKTIGVNGVELEVSNRMLGTILELDDRWDSSTLAAGLR